MTFSYPALSRNPSSIQWWLEANTFAYTSPMDKSTQTVEWPAARWHAILSYQQMADTDWRLLDAFVAQMCGMAGRVYLPVFHALLPKGSYTGGSQQVNGGSQVGKSLILENAPTSRTGWLKAGDFVHLDTAAGRELKRITADANTDINGAVTIQFAPALRGSPADNAPVTVAACNCQMRFKDDQQAQLMVQGGNEGSLTVEFVEQF